MQKNSNTKKEWLTRLLLKIAKEELVEGVKEVLEIKTINSNDRIFKIVVRVKDLEGEYIVHAVIQITWGRNDGHWWRLLSLDWEEVKR
jgi:hypothetical protein